MKVVLFTLSLLVASIAALPPPYYDQVQDDKIHIPEKCEDVLSVKVCNQLEETAKNLKLTSDQVKDAVIDAVKNGKTKSEEIYNSAKDFLQQKVLSKKCEDFTSPDNCAKLRDLAKKLKIKAADVEKFVIQAVADGAVKVNDLYNKVLDYYKKEVATKKCEDFLSKTNCDRIRDVAATFKIKADALEKAFVEAVMKAYIEGKDVLTETFNKLKDLAKNTTCEDLLNPDLCKTLRKYANLTKVSFPKIMDAVRDSIVKGYKIGKGLLKAIYDITDYFYDCEDVFTQSSCDRLKYWLGKLGVKAAEIDRIVREYAKKGFETASDLYKKIYDFLKEQVVCKISPWCKTDGSMFAKRNISIDDIMEKLKKIN